MILRKILVILLIPIVLMLVSCLALENFAGDLAGGGGGSNNNNGNGGGNGGGSGDWHDRTVVTATTSEAEHLGTIRYSWDFEVDGNYDLVVYIIPMRDWDAVGDSDDFTPNLQGFHVDDDIIEDLGLHSDDKYTLLDTRVGTVPEINLGREGFFVLQHGFYRDNNESVVENANVNYAKFISYDGKVYKTANDAGIRDLEPEVKVIVEFIFPDHDADYDDDDDDDDDDDNHDPEDDVEHEFRGFNVTLH